MYIFEKEAWCTYLHDKHSDTGNTFVLKKLRPSYYRLRFLLQFSMCLEVKHTDVFDFEINYAGNDFEINYAG